MSRYLGIDLGTSFIKGGVLDLEQAAVRHVRRVPFPGPVRLRPPYVYETDPADVLARTREVLETLAEAAPDATGLVVCSQMHALVLTTETGEACSPCLVWQDQRA